GYAHRAAPKLAEASVRMALNLVKSEMPIAPGHRFIREQTETNLQQASRAESLPYVSRKFRPALSANSGGSLHLMDRPSVLHLDNAKNSPIGYARKTAMR